MRVLVVGSGAVATVLVQAWRAAGLVVEQRSSRLPWTDTDAFDAVMICVADRAIAEVARSAVAAGAAASGTALLHGAGALPPSEVFADVRERVGGVALCHPLLAMADGEAGRLAGATLAVAGDPTGRAVALRLAESAGGRAIVLDEQGLSRYHAAAAMVANHALALAAAGEALLCSLGIARDDAARALGKLIMSSAENWVRLGLPAALTGPIARGDCAIVARHLASLPPTLNDLYRMTGRALLDLARAKGQAPAAALDEVEALLADSPAKQEG